MKEDLDEETKAIVDLFFLEAAEHLERMEAGLLQLEDNPRDPELLATIFRSAHSIKGTAAAVSFEAIPHFTHSMESLLDLLREGKLPVTRRLVDLLLSSLDVLKHLIASSRSGTDEVSPEAAALVVELEQTIAVAPTNAATAPVQSQSAPSTPASIMSTCYSIDLKPSPDVFTLGLDPVLVLRDLARLGDITEIETDTQSLPGLEQLDPELCYLTWKLKLNTCSTIDAIKEELIFVSDITHIERVESGNDSAASVAAPQSTLPDQPTSGEGAQSGGAGKRKNTKALQEASSIRVPTAKVDKLVDLVGELMIAQSMAGQIVSDFSDTRLNELKQAIDLLASHTRELQAQIMRVRMLPIGTIFNRFPRLVRDVASTLGKNVNLVIEGEDTELDKGVVEQLSDPLTHIIRNSIDHGLELPAQRRAAGKDEQGTIRMTASHQAGNMIIEITDDGRGLNTAKIRQIAIERGLIEATDDRTDEQINVLIFHPGFSTADKVSDLSGRGVGMDVVRRNIEALKGTVTVESVPGQGCTVRIKLPLTLAILDGLSLRVGQERFILPLVSIIETIRPRPEQLASVANHSEVVVVRKEPLPLIRLHELFAIPDAVTEPCMGLLVILEHEGTRFALLVDELLGQQQVVVKSLEAHFRKVGGVIGATILGDGRVALILDVAGMSAINRDEEKRLAA